MKTISGTGEVSTISAFGTSTSGFGTSTSGFGTSGACGGAFFVANIIFVLAFDCLGCMVALKFHYYIFFKMQPNTFAKWWMESTVF